MPHRSPARLKGPMRIAAQGHLRAGGQHPGHAHHHRRRPGRRARAHDPHRVVVPAEPGHAARPGRVHAPRRQPLVPAPAGFRVALPRDEGRPARGRGRPGDAPHAHDPGRARDRRARPAVARRPARRAHDRLVRAGPGRDRLVLRGGDRHAGSARAGHEPRGLVPGRHARCPRRHLHAAPAAGGPVLPAGAAARATPRTASASRRSGVACWRRPRRRRSSAASSTASSTDAASGRSSSTSCAARDRRRTCTSWRFTAGAEAARSGAAAGRAGATVGGWPSRPSPRTVRDWFEPRLRGADAGPGAGLAGHRDRRARPHLGAHRLGQDARRLPVGPRPPRRRPDAGATTARRLVYVSPLKALSYDIERNLRAPLRGIGADRHRRDPHRRHAAARARADAPHAAGHPHHDARVAVPHAHLAGARDADAASRRSSSTRSTPSRPRSAARTWP